jgi:glycine oxidase
MEQVAQVRNPRLLKALRVAAEDRGVEIVERCEVTGLTRRGDRVSGVSTSQGEFEAEAVVVCGGAWSASILGELARVPEVAPVRGQMLLFRTPPQTVRRIVLAGARYVIPRRDGRVLVGSTVEHVGFDKSTTEEAKQELREAAFGLIPALQEAPLEQHWAGLRPGSPNGVPYIGPHPELAGLYVNAGHYRNGVVMGLASARLLGDLVLGRPPVLDPDAYGLDGEL